MNVPRFSDREAHLATLRRAALQAVDPYRAAKAHLFAEDVAPFERVFIVGAGKAGVAMARAATEIAGDKIAGGVMAVPAMAPFPRPLPPLRKSSATREGEPTPSLAPRFSALGRAGEGAVSITFIEGGHPLPSEGSLAAGRAIATLLTQTTRRDLVIALISGGGSALMELPKPGLTLDDLQNTNRQLLQCGATIHEFNTVRKALSQIKGGGLLRLAHPAHVLALILSDVVGNDLSIIASGPTVAGSGWSSADEARISEWKRMAGSGWGADTADGLRRIPALAIVEQYQLQAMLRPSVIATLQKESVTSAPSSVAESVDNRLIASNRIAGEAAVVAAREIGFDAQFLGDDWQGEAREIGHRFASLLISPPIPDSSPLSQARSSRSGEGGRGVRVFIAGGETTVTVRGTGKGGRNQEAALAAAIAMDGQPNVVISTFGTDGIDGPTDAAGATVTGQTVARARALGLDPQAFLDNNDAYTFFAALGDLVITGPTGTNVNDLTFGLAY